MLVVYKIWYNFSVFVCKLNCRMVSMDWQTTIIWYGLTKLPRYKLISSVNLLIIVSLIIKVPSFVMYFLDSGGGSYPELVYDDQIEWLKDTAAALHTKFQSLPAIAFFHIPTWEFTSCQLLSSSLCSSISLSLCSTGYQGMYKKDLCIGTQNDTVSPQIKPNRKSLPLQHKLTH